MARKPYDLPLTALPVQKFYWEKGNQILSADASDFGPARDGLWWLGRLYNDACDVGIEIANSATGRAFRFVLAKERVQDGDLKCWEFVPETGPGRPACPITRVVIYND